MMISHREEAKQRFEESRNNVLHLLDVLLHVRGLNFQGKTPKPRGAAKAVWLGPEQKVW